MKYKPGTIILNRETNERGIVINTPIVDNQISVLKTQVYELDKWDLNLVYQIGGICLTGGI